MIPTPGDCILYPCGPRSAFSSRFVGAGELLFGMGKGMTLYSHAAILSDEIRKQYEATFPFTGKFGIDYSREFEIWNLGDPNLAQRRAILRWCSEHEGDWYNLTGVLTFDLIRLPGSYYCSQFACLAYASAGLHPGDLIMSPDSIPQYRGARKVFTHKP